MMQRLLELIRTQRAFFWVCVGCAVVVTAMVFIAWQTSGLTTLAYNPADPGFNRAFWEQEIERRGGDEAHQEFKAIMANQHPSVQHLSSHVFGSLLAERFGPEGIKYCDKDYSFGCYHGFLSEAVATGGTALVPTLDQACNNIFGPEGTGCQHGIGHGLLEYVGYSRVNKALELCELTTPYLRMLGCSAGVFMEYDFPLVGTVEAGVTQVRPFDPIRPHEPCDRVDAAYEDQCYVAHGRYLRQFFRGEGEHQKVAAYCAELPERARQYCFIGVGIGETIWEDYAPPKTLAYCGQFGAKDELACRAGAWWEHYQESPEQRARADEVCQYDDPARKEACRTLADFSEGKPIRI